MKEQTLFLGGMFPDKLLDDIILNSKGNIQNAADALQKSFIKGLSVFYPDMYIINMPFVGAYPIRYKKMFVKSSSLDQGKSVGYCNILYFKHFFIKKAVRKAVLEWVKLATGKKIVFIYSLNDPFLEVLSEIKPQYPDLHICQIVPDLIDGMIVPKGFLYKIHHDRTIRKFESIYKYIDSYVLLSEHMKDRLPIGTLPYTVVEGIFNAYDDDFEVHEKLNDKIVLYTGSLAKRYGIMNLIEVFKLLKEENIYLYICGRGDSEADIIEASADNPRIVYKGVLKRKEVLELQKKVTLLVNPRNAEGEYTKYSFPSKTMEYMASGVPTLLYKLPGIPDEYYNYCYSLEDDSVATLSEAIKTICYTDKHVLEEKGRTARDFIIRQKSPEKQCSKIVNMLKLIK